MRYLTTLYSYIHPNLVILSGKNSVNLQCLHIFAIANSLLYIEGVESCKFRHAALTLDFYKESLF